MLDQCSSVFSGMARTPPIVSEPRYISLAVGRDRGGIPGLSADNTASFREAAVSHSACTRPCVFCVFCDVAPYPRLPLSFRISQPAP